MAGSGSGLFEESALQESSASSSTECSTDADVDELAGEIAASYKPVRNLKTGVYHLFDGALLKCGKEAPLSFSHSEPTTNDKKCPRCFGSAL